MNNYYISDKESQIINALKTIFIVFVVFIHTRAYVGKGYVDMVDGAININVPFWLYNIEFFISEIIARVAVPGFFVISSILLYKRNFTWKDNIVKKIRTLVVPYIIIITSWIIIYAIAQRISYIATFFSNESKIITKWGLFQYIDAYLGITQSPLVYPLWFIKDLFILNCLSIFIKKVIDKIPLISFVVLWAIELSEVSCPKFFIETSSLVYFCMGYYIVKYGIHFKVIELYKKLLLCALYIVTCILVFRVNGFLLYKICFNLNICIGFVFWVMVCDKYCRNKAIQTLAQYSFNIFILHEMILRTALKAIARYGGTSVVFQLIQYFVIPIVIIVFCVVFSTLIKRKIPKVYHVLFGAR